MLAMLFLWLALHSAPAAPVGTYVRADTLIPNVEWTILEDRTVLATGYQEEYTLDSAYWFRLNSAGDSIDIWTTDERGRAYIVQHTPVAFSADYGVMTIYDSRWERR